MAFKKYEFVIFVSTQKNDHLIIPEVFCLLGQCYELGEGVANDSVKTVVHYKIAIKYGFIHANASLHKDIGAAIFLGHCYDRGLSDVPINLRKANYYYNSAMDLGSFIARKYLENVQIKINCKLFMRKLKIANIDIINSKYKFVDGQMK
eukprot:Pgem_evm1s19970